MEALQATALTGIAILAASFVTTTALYYKWWRVSAVAVKMALNPDVVTDKQLMKVLRRLRFYSSCVGYSSQLTNQIPILLPALIVLWIISVVVG